MQSIFLFADQFDLHVYEVIVSLCGRYSFLSARKVRGLGARGREGEATPVIILLFSAFFSRAIARLNWLKTC